MVLDWIASQPINPRDPRPRGVREDRLAVTREGRPMRGIHYRDPVRGQDYGFLTNEMDLPAGGAGRTLSPTPGGGEGV